LTESNQKIVCVGLNHQTANLALRERFIFDSDCIGPALLSLREKTAVDEALIISTCNRTEIYVCPGNQAAVIGWLSNYFGCSVIEVEQHLYHYSDSGAFLHAARVASGLDSMVIGETQILGQLKHAYREAQTAEMLGKNLHKLFQDVFSASKAVRTETEIGAHSVSIAATALRATKRIFSNLSAQSVLFIGAGEMIKLCSKHFLTEVFKKVAFSNRSIQNARLLASQVNGEYHDLQSVHKILSSYDIIVSCTGSPTPIIGKGSVEAALQERKRKPIVMFDLAVPRDIEPEIQVLDDVFLFSIDDLGVMVQDSFDHRKAAVQQAEELLINKVSEFDRWLQSSESTKVIRKYRNFGEKFVEDEISKALAVIDRGGNVNEAVHNVAHSIKNKFLDRPSRVLNRLQGARKKLLSESLLSLFELEDRE